MSVWTVRFLSLIHILKTDFSFVNALGYEITREKLYKTNKHIFLQKMENNRA